MEKRLAEDVIVEILVKLPVKSLLRLRCVCKSWSDLIKNPYFINRHLVKNHKNNDSILVLRGLEDWVTNVLSFHSYESLNVISSHLQLPHFSYIFTEVSGVCNGLLCFSDGVKFVLCNPAMREFKVLPPRPFPCPEGWKCRVEKAGLGFDSITNDYKLVTIVGIFHGGVIYLGFDPIYKVEIYNLSTNSWREIDYDVPNFAYAGGGTLFNGASHWVANNGCILSFDMSTELFRYIELPHIDAEEWTFQRLMVLNESLALFSYTEFWDTQQQQFVEIWVMHQYGVAESWTKQCIVGPLTEICCPLLFWKNEAILLEILEGRCGGRLISCALDTHEINDFDIHGIRETFRVIVYHESLISVE